MAVNKVNRGNLAKILQQAWRERIKVKEADKTKTMTAWEMACRQMAKKAAAGDVQAFRLLTQLLEANAGPKPKKKQWMTVSEHERFGR